MTAVSLKVNIYLYNFYIIVFFGLILLELKHRTIPQITTVVFSNRVYTVKAADVKF